MNKIELMKIIDNEWIKFVEHREFNVNKDVIDKLCNIFKYRISEVADKIKINTFSRISVLNDDDIREMFINIKYKNIKQNDHIKNIFSIETCYEICINKFFNDELLKLKNKIESIEEDILSCLD